MNMFHSGLDPGPVTPFSRMSDIWCALSLKKGVRDIVKIVTARMVWKNGLVIRLYCTPTAARIKENSPYLAQHQPHQYHDPEGQS